MYEKDLETPHLFRLRPFHHRSQVLFYQCVEHFMQKILIHTQVIRSQLLMSHSCYLLIFTIYHKFNNKTMSRYTSYNQVVYYSRQYRFYDKQIPLIDIYIIYLLGTSYCLYYIYYYDLPYYITIFTPHPCISLKLIYCTYIHIYYNTYVQYTS